ncbi:hypothetical protein J6590_091784, partial [Homalodisca vitripennis]
GNEIQRVSSTKELEHQDVEISQRPLTDMTQMHFSPSLFQILKIMKYHRFRRLKIPRGIL